MTAFLRTTPPAARRALWLVGALLGAALAQADSITLLPTVRVDTGTAKLTLAEIAKLEGPAALALADTPVYEFSKTDAAWTTIDVARVREALKDHKDLDWSNLSIHGLATQVRRLTPPEPAAPKLETNEEQVEADPGPTLRIAVAQRLCDMLGVPADHLRLKFEDRDQKGLSISTIDRIVDIQPLGSGDRIPLAIRVYQGETIVANLTIRVDAEVLRPVAIATGPLRRGQTLEASDFTLEDRWLPPSVRPADPDSAAGKAVRQRVNPGEVLGQEDIQPPVVVKRGELVMVHCVNPGFVVKLTARATTDAREGESITFETLEPDRKARRQIVARMAGPGTAIASALTTTTDNPSRGAAR